MSQDETRRQKITMWINHLYLYCLANVILCSIHILADLYLSSFVYDFIEDTYVNTLVINEILRYTIVSLSIFFICLATYCVINKYIFIGVSTMCVLSFILTCVLDNSVKIFTYIYLISSLRVLKYIVITNIVYVSNSKIRKNLFNVQAIVSCIYCSIMMYCTERACMYYFDDNGKLHMDTVDAKNYFSQSLSKEYNISIFVGIFMVLIVGVYFIYKKRINFTDSNIECDSEKILPLSKNNKNIYIIYAVGIAFYSVIPYVFWSYFKYFVVIDKTFEINIFDISCCIYCGICLAVMILMVINTTTLLFLFTVVSFVFMTTILMLFILQVQIFYIFIIAMTSVLIIMYLYLPWIMLAKIIYRLELQDKIREHVAVYFSLVILFEAMFSCRTVFKEFDMFYIMIVIICLKIMVISTCLLGVAGFMSKNEKKSNKIYIQ
ncbi:hypothetical protein nvc2_043 [Namao virus]|nr:hypothetical protein nvc2_043 [Namao virus]